MNTFIQEMEHLASQVTGTQQLTSPVVVFSHLRWHSVTQRPQHIMHRLANHVPVLFVEEPIGYAAGEEGTARKEPIAKNLTVLSPRISSVMDTKGLAQIVKKEMKRQGIHSPVLWLYSPMFVDIVSEIDHAVLVYDCMDELSAFHGAPVELTDREKILLKKADVVFTGGYSLYEAKMHANPNVFCFPSSVDKKHFEKAFAKKTEIPADMANIPGPRVLFYGVVDERMDMALLQAVTKRLPHISFVLIGPIAKIDPASIPASPNLHYLGNRSYDVLPAYLKGADVTMMPFALNDATRFISPTKTLEFMAALKPIVSTPIRDVARFYSDIVGIGDTPELFATHILAALGETKKEKAARVKKEHQIIEKNSWDKTVSEMMDIIQTNASAAEVVPSPLPFIPELLPLSLAYGDR